MPNCPPVSKSISARTGPPVRQRAKSAFAPQTTHVDVDRPAREKAEDVRRVEFFTVSARGGQRRFEELIQMRPIYCKSVSRIPGITDSLRRSLAQLCATLAGSQEWNAIVACLQDGSKVVIAKHGTQKGNPIRIAFVRSNHVDKVFLEKLSYWTGISKVELESQFVQMPELADARRAMEEAKGARIGKAVREDLQLIGKFYQEWRSPGGWNAFQADTRVFTAMGALHIELCHLNLQVLLIERETPKVSGQVGRIYNYLTTWPIPGRPPICSVRATGKMCKLVQGEQGIAAITSFESSSGRVRWVEDLCAAALPESRPSAMHEVCGKHLTAINGNAYCFRIETPTGSALLEIDAERADPGEVWLAKTLVASALDTSGYLEVELLKRAVEFTTPQQAERFRRLVNLLGYLEKAPPADLESGDAFDRLDLKALGRQLLKISTHVESNYATLLHPSHKEHLKRCLLLPVRSGSKLRTRL